MPQPRPDERRRGYDRFDALTALAIGLGLPVVETIRRGLDFDEFFFYTDDYLFGILMIGTAVMLMRGRRYAPCLLAGAWGVFLGGCYGSFFGQWYYFADADPSGMPVWLVLIVKGPFFFFGLYMFVRTIRHAVARVSHQDQRQVENQ